MNSSTPKETIKNLIPVLSEKEKQEIQAYYTVYEKYSEEFSAKATEDLKNHPVFGKLIRDIPKEVSESRNKVSRALQKDAIVNDNWQPYIEYQIAQGVTYAKMGLDFKSWYEVIAMVRNYMRPLLRKEHENAEKLFSSLSGMNRFLDISMGIMGEAYMQEKEEIVRSNEAKLQQAQAIAHMGSWDIDFATGIAIWSEELCRIHGLLPEENKQSFESWLSFIHPEDLEYVKKEIEKSNASLSDTISNHRIMRKDGTVRNIYTLTKFVLNHEGKPIGLYGIAQDVTEQKIAEAALRSNEAKLKQAQAIAHIGSWEIDFATGISTWSEEACRIHGLLPDENQQSFESWLSFVHPEDLEYVKKEIEKSNASLSDTILNHRIVRKDGTVRNIYSISKFALNHEGKPTGLYGIAHDVTEQKIAEEVIKKQNEELEQKVIERTAQLDNTIQQLNEYKHFFNNNNDLCGIANSEGYFEIINANFNNNTLGYSEIEFLKTPFIELIHPDDIPATLHEYEKLKSGALVINFINRYRKKDGSYLYLDWNATPNPITQKLYCVARDITERKKTEEQLRDVNKELEAFSYSISHDLRAPLRAVNGYAQMLNEDYGTKLDEEGKRIIESIRYNAGNMGTLIDELLAFSKLGRKEVQRTKINMNELVEGVFKDMDKSFTHKAEIKIGKLHQVEADYGLLRQAMLNLISNALKYSSKKEHPIVEIFSEEKNGGIVFSVKDNGAGFDMKYYDKLFGVFQRLHKQSEFDGVGVGLAIVQRVIAKHGGKVWAEGKVNEGAAFNFTLTKN